MRLTVGDRRRGLSWPGVCGPPAGERRRLRPAVVAGRSVRVGLDVIQQAALKQHLYLTLAEVVAGGEFVTLGGVADGDLPAPDGLAHVRGLQRAAPLDSIVVRF